jgi:hypothetical protein
MAQDHQILLYLHTHWDREWYWSFGAYRTQLVQVVESVVQMLETRRTRQFYAGRPDLLARRPSRNGTIADRSPYQPGAKAQTISWPMVRPGRPAISWR